MPNADNINRRAGQLRQENARADEERRITAAATREERRRQKEERRTAATPTRSERRDARRHRREERLRQKAERTALALKIASYAERNRIPADRRVVWSRRAWVAGTYEVPEYFGEAPRTSPVYACGNGKFYVNITYKGYEGVYWEEYKSLPDEMDEAIARLVARGQEPWA